jgi:hypothetical protein
MMRSLGESIMMNPLHIPPNEMSVQDTPSPKESSKPQVKKLGLTDWIRQHFGSEPPHRHSENFFISDVTEGGIGSHHRHQLFRPDKRH